MAGQGRSGSRREMTPWDVVSMVLEGLACLAQHWLSMALGAMLLLLLYYDMIREERNTVKKLGRPYQDYMQRVPRMNVLLGLVRAARRG